MKEKKRKDLYSNREKEENLYFTWYQDAKERFY